MDRRIAQEQERRKKDKQSRAVEHYWQEVGRHSDHTQMAAKTLAGTQRASYSTTNYQESKDQRETFHTKVCVSYGLMDLIQLLA